MCTGKCAYRRAAARHIWQLLFFAKECLHSPYSFFARKCLHNPYSVFTIECLRSLCSASYDNGMFARSLCLLLIIKERLWAYNCYFEAIVMYLDETDFFWRFGQCKAEDGDFRVGAAEYDIYLE